MGRSSLAAPSRSSISWGYSVIGRPEARCHSASMEWVLPPPKLVCKLITGEAFISPESLLTARVIRSRKPPVRKVRRKNSTGSVYSGSPSPRATIARSAANSAARKLPFATSSCGRRTSRQGGSPTEPTSVAPAILTTRRSSCSEETRRRSIRERLTSSADSGAPMARSSRSAVSKAR